MPTSPTKRIFSFAALAFIAFATMSPAWADRDEDDDDDEEYSAERRYYIVPADPQHFEPVPESMARREFQYRRSPDAPPDESDSAKTFPKESAADRASGRERQLELLESELASERDLLAKARKEFVQESRTTHDAGRLQRYRDEAELHERNIDALRHELAHLYRGEAAPRPQGASRSCMSAGDCSTKGRVTAPRPAAGKSTADDAAYHAAKMIGVRYRFGGASPSTGFDCSGLVQFSYRQAGIIVPRSTEQQRRASRRIAMSDLRPGDLLFFNQQGKRNSHVGIYLGNDEFVHAATSHKRVRADQLHSPSSYWHDHLSEVRRLDIDGVANARDRTITARAN